MASDVKFNAIIDFRVFSGTRKSFSSQNEKKPLPGEEFAAVRGLTTPKVFNQIHGTKSANASSSVGNWN